MIESLAIASSGKSVVASTTATTVQIPFDSSGGYPRHLYISSTAPVYVKVGSSSVVAVAGDLLVQPADSVLIDCFGCTYISVISISGTAFVSLSPSEYGRWNEANPDALTLLRYYGNNAHIYLPGVGALNGLTAGNYLDAGTTPAVVDGLVYQINDPLGAINATQPTAGSRPTLRRGALNLLTYSQDFTNAAWTNDINTTTFTPNTAIAPDGSLTADSITVSGGTSRTFQMTAPGVLTGKRVTYSVWLWSMSGKATIAMRIYDNPTGINASIKTIALTSTPTRYSLTSVLFTTTDSQLACGFENRVAQGGDGIAGTFEAWGAQLEIGSAASAYTPTTTAAASNASAGSYSLQFSGAQSMALGSVPFQMSDDHAVVAGCSTTSTTGNSKTIYGQGGATTTPRIQLSFSVSGFAEVAWRDDAGTLASWNSGVVYASPTVLSAVKQSNAKRLRVNGAQVGATNNTALGATTLTAAAIGVCGATTPYDYHQGSIGPVIAIKGTVSDSDLLTLERFVASLTPNAPSF